jgi:hypothetical protein
MVVRTRRMITEDRKNSYVTSGTSPTGPAEQQRKKTGGKQKKQQRKETEGKETNIAIGTLNIVDGRGNRLEMACNRLARIGVDIAIITETKLNGHHTTSAYGYTIVATKCENQHQGGVALAYRTDQDWHIENEKAFGPNVLKATLVHEDRRTPIIGVYFPPSEEDMTTMVHLEMARVNEEADRTIILGDLNVNLKKPRNDREQEIVEALGANGGLRDISTEFKMRRGKPHKWTWRKWREGERVSAICDYILSGRTLQWKNFVNVDVDFDTDHRLIKGKLRSRK